MKRVVPVSLILNVTMILLGVTGIGSAVLVLLIFSPLITAVTVVMATLCILLSSALLFTMVRMRNIRNQANVLVSKCHEATGGTVVESLTLLDAAVERLSDSDRCYHLIRVLKDDSPDLQPIVEELAHFGIVFDHNGFVLVAFDACHRQPDIQVAEHFHDRDRILRSLLRDLAPKAFVKYVVDVEEKYVCLLNLPYAEDDAYKIQTRRIVDSYVTSVIEQLEERFGLRTAATVSSLQYGVQSLPDAYKQVDGLFEYKIITNNPESVLHFTEECMSFESWYLSGNKDHKFEELKRLIASIQIEDFTSAKHYINEFVQHDYSMQNPSLPIARSRQYGIIDAVLNILGPLCDQLDEEFLRHLNPANRIIRCVSHSELADTLNSIFDEIISYYAERKKEEPPEWFETIRAYIDTHYNDMNINVAQIADHFHISSAYYARVFKKYTGISPLDYIHKLRMKSAKRLMAKGVCVKDAAEMVGYGTPVTMSRAFKRYEGLTPGAYVKNH